MQTVTSLCNAALAHLGQHRIVSIDEVSPPAEECRRSWDITRDALLREFPWNFSIKRSVLTALVETPAFDWAYYYALPSDYLSTLEFNGVEGGTGRTNFEVEGGKLLTDDTTAQLRYIAKVEDVSLWDSSFSEAFALRLAAKIAPTLTSSTTMPESLLARAAQAAVTAKGTDQAESRPRVITEAQDSAYMKARCVGAYYPQDPPNWL